MVGIREGNGFTIRLVFLGNIKKHNSCGYLILHYSDILGKKYEQQITIDFLDDNSKDKDICISTDVPMPE